ncbi:hypothetical protein [Thermus sediminis]
MEGVMAVLPKRVSALEHRVDPLRQGVKAELHGPRQIGLSLRSDGKARGA